MSDALFDDLDAILAEAETKTAEARTLAAKQKRLAAISSFRSPGAEAERQELLADIRRLEEGVVWTSRATVALFHSQHCTTCGHTNTVFSGWFTEQLHKNAVACRRLLAGAPIEPLPRKREEHWEQVSLCINCFKE